jgi:hypothetical protein
MKNAMIGHQETAKPKKKGKKTKVELNEITPDCTIASFITETICLVANISNHFRNPP